MPTSTRRSIDLQIVRYPRETLIRTPTPLDPLPRFGAYLDLEVHLKRDDLTGLALGGDKPRKLEYELGRARGQRADVLVTTGGAQSNHARLTAAAARLLGFDCEVVLHRDERALFQANLLTVHLFGATVHWVDGPDHWALEAPALELCERLRAEGRRPYYIPVSGTTSLSSLGYVRAGLELADQLAEGHIAPDALYLPFGTGGIFTAMLLALRERGLECPVIGISVNRDAATCRQQFETWWQAICQLLDRDPARPRGSHEVRDDQVGRGYGDATETCLDAILLMARTEGILLDPVYSGKTVAGLLADHAAKRWAPGSRIVVLHSGGVPALFAYAGDIEAHLHRRGLTVTTS